MKPTHITRRRFLKTAFAAGGTFAAASALSGCGGAATQAPAPTQAPAKPAAPATVATTGDKFDWKRYKGEKLEVLLVKGSLYDILKPYHKEFEELTGITIGAEDPPEQQQRQKLVVEFNSGNTSFDVVAFSYHVQKRLIEKNKWTYDLTEYLKDPTMTSPDFDYQNDVSAAGKLWAGTTDGRTPSMPIKIDYWCVFYNKDLLDAKGIKYPTTFVEMIDAAKKVHDPAKSVYGFVGRGLKNANVPLWTSFMLGYNMDTVVNGQLMTETAEAVEAAKVYQDLLKNYSAPGVAGFNWNESQSLFALGQAAFWFDGVGFAPPLEDATKSKVVGKVGYGVPPAGPKSKHSAMFGDGMGISSFSKKKGPAWYYVQWATSKAMQVRYFAGGGGSVPRNSVYANPDALKNLTVPKTWVDCVLECAKVGRPGLPIIQPVTEFRDIFGVALTNMITGADPSAELKKATAEFKPILDKSEQG